MKAELKQTFLKDLEGICDDYKRGNKAQAFEILCALIGEILKELPTDGN
ncbi:MAG: hypothetical protein M1490_03825 [Candidatus Bathyarchaeota archaeon]|nr:hypothetical protein [Candidatus Bathyarchaeota archaeon]